MNGTNGFRLNFENKFMLAPMVRVGTLPMRLLALEYGADIVFCEELIDRKLQRSERVVNDALGTVDYIDTTDGTVVFRTCERERPYVVLQIGTSDAERALEVAKRMQDDVAAFDINMGCPKEFSIKGGMGAALLKKPEKIRSIVTTLVQNINKPITCKIRILPSLEDTLKLCSLIEECGASAITVHGRTISERPQHANHNDFIKAVAEHLTIPVIANGGSREMHTHADMLEFRRLTGASSVMIGRAAETNCSIFRPQGLLNIHTVIKTYLKYAIEFDGAFSNTKYTVQHMLRDLQDSPLGKKFLESQTSEQLCSLWSMESQLQERQKMSLCPKKMNRIHSSVAEHIPVLKKSKMETAGGDVLQMDYKFVRNHFPNSVELPKSCLLQWTRKNGLEQPHYRTEQHDKLFQSVVTVDDKKYTSSHWEKNKKHAEQSAAMVVLCDLGLVEMKGLGWAEETEKFDS